MSSILRGSKKIIVGLGLAGCGAAAAVIFGLSDESRVAKAASIFTDNIHGLYGSSGFSVNRPSVGPSSCNSTSNYVKWDFNWDKREAEELIKPLKGRFRNEDEENSYNEKIEKARVRIIMPCHVIV